MKRAKKVNVLIATINNPTYLSMLPSEWNMPIVSPMKISRKRIVKPKNIVARERANFEPTEELFLQCGQLATELAKAFDMKISLQCAHWTRHVPGGARTAVPTGDVAASVITRRQCGRGQAIRVELALQTSKQLHGQRTYFFPGGAARIGVTSWHCWHRTTC